MPGSSDRGNIVDGASSDPENQSQLLQAELEQRILELAATRAELRELDQLKAAFISTAAHELRNPLTAITGYLELFQDGDTSNLTERQRAYLAVIEASTQRLVSIISDLLDITRVESGRVALVLQEVELGWLIKQATATHTDQLRDKELSVTLDAPAGLPCALCDVARASQILNHLLNHVIKLTPQGGSITLSLTRAPDDGYLLVVMEDGGAGMLRAEHDQAFKRFSRTGQAADSSAAHVGLDLQIARALIELHGGRIWSGSAVDRHAVVYVTLPTANQAAEQAAASRTSVK